MNFILNDLLRVVSRHWIKLSLLAAIAIWSVILAWPSSAVQIIFCNAGQGDETLIQRGFSQILIDASRPGKALNCLSKHMPFFDRTIDTLIVTHPQLDHFGGAESVIERYHLMHYVYNGFGSESPEWMQLSKKLLEKNVAISTVSVGDEIKIGTVTLQVLWPKSFKGAALSTQGRALSDGKKSHSSRDPNVDAIVLAMRYGNFSALFTGDIGKEEEEKIIADYNFYKGYNNYKNYNVLKVAHHGSKTSSSEAFLNVIRPLLAVIEVGKNNYGHPTKEAMDRLKAVGARVMRTDQDGDVVVETDGTQWRVSSKLKN